MSPTVGLMIGIVLIVGNGFFVGVEFALLAARQTKLTTMASGSKRAGLALKATQQLPLMISGCQFGITICSLGLGAAAEPALSKLIEPLFETAGLPETFLHPTGFAIALLITSVLHMVLGEMVPKNVALAGPERTAIWLAPLLLAFIKTFRPLIVGLTAIATFLLRKGGIDTADAHTTAYNADQVADLITQAQQEGLLQKEEHTHAVEALKFRQQTAMDALLPTKDLITINPSVTPEEIELLVGTTGFSRFPMITAQQKFLGYIHFGDVLRLPSSQRHLPLPADIVRALPKIKSDAALHEVLSLFQKTGTHLAQVLCPLNKPLGAIALEDVLELLVGEVLDATAGQ